MDRITTITARRIVSYETLIVTRSASPESGKRVHLPKIAGTVLVAAGGLALGAGVAALPAYVPRVLAALRHVPQLGMRRAPLALPPTTGPSGRVS